MTAAPARFAKGAAVFFIYYLYARARKKRGHILGFAGVKTTIFGVLKKIPKKRKIFFKKVLTSPVRL